MRLRHRVSREVVWSWSTEKVSAQVEAVGKLRFFVHQRDIARIGGVSCSCGWYGTSEAADAMLGSTSAACDFGQLRGVFLIVP